MIFSITGAHEWPSEEWYKCIGGIENWTKEVKIQQPLSKRDQKNIAEIEARISKLKAFVKRASYKKAYRELVKIALLQIGICYKPKQEP